MNKIGIIFCAFNCGDTIEKCLEPWKQIKNENFVYSCVSVPFKEYQNFNLPEDNTINLVCATNIMDYHVTEPKFIEETHARGLCLDYLVKQNCELIIQVDGDEHFTPENIVKILEYVEKNPQIAWFKLSLKNYVLNEKTYLEKPFTPARIYRVNFLPFKLGDFYDDNNICYLHKDFDKSISDQVLKNKIIPKEIAWVSHYSWMNNQNSLNKINYQISRGWKCSYFWDNEKGLIFNPDFYKGKEFPQIVQES